MTREELKAKIPFGYGKKIAAELGVTPKTIYLFLNGKSNSYKVENAVLKAIGELKKEKENLLNGY